MELEILRKSWDSINERIDHMAAFNNKLVEHIIAARVMTTIDKIDKLYTGFYTVLAIELVVLIAILVGNPFDFRYHVQYIPYGLLLIGVIVAFFNLLHLHRSIHKVSANNPIDEYLKSIGAIYDRNKRFEKWFGLIFLSIGLSVPFSFLPTKIDRVGLIEALTDTSIMVGINLIIFIAAIKLGAFRNRYRIQLEKDLIAWKQLKALAEEMGR